jgi:hypothetical protein
MAAIGGTPPPGYMNVTLDQLDEIEAAGKELRFETPAQREEYLKLVAQAREDRSGGISNPTLQIPKPLNADELGLVINRLDSSIANLGPNITDIMAMLHEMGAEMRKAGKMARQAGREAEQHTLQAAADKIRSAAALSMAAGIVGGSMQIAGGLTSMAGAVRSANTALGQGQSGNTNVGQAWKNSPTYKGALQDSAVAFKNKMGNAINYKNYDTTGMSSQDRSTLAGVQSAKWNGFSQVMSGSGQVVSATIEFGAKMEEAQKAELDAEARKMSYLVQDEDEVIRNMKELMDVARQKLAEIEQANNAAMSKIWS